MLHLSKAIEQRVRQATIILFQLGAVACIFPNQNYYLQWWADQSLYIAIAYLVLGLLFLLINWPRLMFVCMGCSAVICFFYHEKNNLLAPKTILISPKTEAPEQNTAPILHRDESKKDTQ